MLVVGSDNDTDVMVSAQGLSGLSRLQHLTLCFRACRILGGEALLPLTGLRQLSELNVRSSAHHPVTDFMNKVSGEMCPAQPAGPSCVCLVHGSRELRGLRRIKRAQPPTWLIAVF